MRRILIDSTVEARAKEFAKVMKGNRPDKLDWGNEMPKDKLKAFYNDLVKRSDREDYAKYVYHIIILYENLLVLTPDSFEPIYKRYFDKWDSLLKNEVEYNSKKKKFYEHVTDCMGYTKIQSKLMRQYMKEQRIKTCVYCNAQYAITTEEFEENGVWKRMGTYQFDHRMPKSVFPFLSTSYYNLQPSCPTCNQTKLARTALFNLYTDKKEELDVFRFELTPDKAVTSYVKDDLDSLEVKLKCDSSQELLDNHQDLFHIDLIYAEHVDVVKRIIVILQANSDYYRQSLSESVGRLFPNGVEDPGYFFFGYYMKNENVHLQPLSKLVQDVVEGMKGLTIRS